MSMQHNCACKVFGLLLLNEDIEKFEKAYCEKNREALLDEIGRPDDPMTDEETIEYLLEDVTDSFLCNETMFIDMGKKEGEFETIYVSRDDSDGMFFEPVSSVIKAIEADDYTKLFAYGSEHYWDDCMIIPARRGCSELSILAKRPFYNSVDEVIDEFKERLGELLPDDFDYAERIGEFWYSLFC